MKTLESLYYGNINPSDYVTRRGEPEDKLLNLIVRSEEALAATLTEAQQNHFDQFKNYTDELHRLTEAKAFSDGFSLATRIMMEALWPEK